MTLPNLISFSGAPNAGKDTAADVLVARARFVKTYMAQPLERALIELNPWIPDDFNGSVERFADLYENLGEQAIKNFDESRRLLRILETKIGRRNEQNIWAGEVFDEIESYLRDNKKVALAGVEEKIDLAMVRALGGVCVWINRPIKPRSSTIAIQPSDCDVIVYNDGTVKDLYVNIVEALEEYNTNKETEDNVG